MKVIGGEVPIWRCSEQALNLGKKISDILPIRRKTLSNQSIFRIFKTYLRMFVRSIIFNSTGEFMIAIDLQVT